MATTALTSRTGRHCRVLPVEVAIDPHVRLLGWSEGVVHAVTPGTIEGDAIGRIGSEELWCRTVEQPHHGFGVRGVATEQPVVAQDPEISGLGPWRPGGLLEGLIEIEALDLLALLASLKRTQQIGDLVLTEARKRQVDIGAGLQ